LAYSAAIKALQLRVSMWDGIYTSLKGK